ncbi:hypothetical protein DSM106972_075690 [Dulcicalothrix desertica PCC 7102]|uniref:Uncharacterized protein n=1 Tax=Dulcicalothrix desertica PCC 7102 TaxID=232991 RepID=A0A433V2Y7_9CYAN|nr:hypothetical protein [Dulcicalothrix desertica]RUT00441.1 hypothetical protein DSM106972_075690 [Dulcicalothrix desertica PCC 7102]TWH42547.1 hypothetical protein CAL7102_06211 [Dulcicalothrix desertica PCC 7102]
MSDSTNPLTPIQIDNVPSQDLTNSLTPQQMKPDNTPPKFNLKTAIVKNWKTTTVGVVISFTGFVSFSPQTFGGSDTPFVQVCKYVTSGGLAALGISSKDYNVSGGNGS